MSKLSHRIEAIEYIHAADGKPYRHDFTHDGSEILLRKDGTIAVRNRDRALWDTFNVNGKEQRFLINPPAGSRTTTKRGKKMAKRKMSAAQRKYFGGKRKSNPRGKRKASSVRTIVRYRNAPKAKRRAHRRRRNPLGFSVNGILAKAQQGGVDALCIVGGRAGVRVITSQFDYDDGSMMQAVVAVGSALALGMATERIIGRDAARFVLAGALSRTLEDFIVQADIPHVSEYLGALPNANTAAVYATADQGRSRRLGAWSPGERLGAWSGNGMSRMGAVDSLPTNAVAVYPA